MTGRQDVLEICTRVRASESAVLVGAAIGAGLMADAALRGGADLLIATNAGRLRLMGGSSLACMLPIADNNAMVAAFSRSEILPNTKMPVFFGASCMAPGMEVNQFLTQLSDWGFAGVANFPSAIFHAGSLRQRLEGAGLGFGMEVAMVASAARHRLSSLAYVRAPDEARRMAEAGADIININLGWNTGGVQGVSSHFSIAEAIAWVRHMVEVVRRTGSEALCVMEGGPIEEADDMLRVCLGAQVRGYIGGSTIDRVPLEISVSDKISSFKTVHLLKRQVAQLEQKLGSRGIARRIPGTCEAIRRVVTLAERVAATDLPVLITGEPGTGRRLVAQTVHAFGSRRGTPLKTLHCAAMPAHEIEHELFGRPAANGRRRRIGQLAVSRGGTLLVTELCQAPADVQMRLLGLLAGDLGISERDAGLEGVRLIVTARAEGLAPAARVLMTGTEIHVPALRERIEDIPLLVRQILSGIERRPAVSPDLDQPCYRLLMAYDWPENLPQLRRVLASAAMGGEDGRISVARLRKALEAESRAIPREPVLDEKDWLLDGLRRHRFRRAEAAGYLGISRKTLYNRMKRHGLL